MGKKIGFGIIGCGVIAPRHAEAIRKADGAELIACCDIIDEKAEQFAKEEGAEFWYKDYKEMLKRDDIDSVCICTPSGMHGDMVIDCAEAGKHVMCEKPLDIKMEKLDSMVEACRKAGVKLGGIFQRRTYETSQRIKEAVENGELGKMILGDAYLKYYRSQEYYDKAEWRGTWELDGGGALMNQGVHGIDLLQWIMGDIESVYARNAALARDIEVEDTAVVNLKFKNGAFGVIEGTTSVYPAQPTTLHIHGDKGSIILEEQTIKKFELIDKDVNLNTEGDEKAGGSSDPDDIASTGHIMQIQDLVEAINEDREPMVNGESARKAVEVILAIYESAQTGNEVKIDDLKK